MLGMDQGCVNVFNKYISNEENNKFVVGMLTCVFLIHIVDSLIAAGKVPMRIGENTKIRYYCT